jgi:hypothetical protein
LRGLSGSLHKQKSWKTSKTAEEQSQKRQRFANLESEDLKTEFSLIGSYRLFGLRPPAIFCLVNFSEPRIKLLIKNNLSIVSLSSMCIII